MKRRYVLVLLLLVGLVVVRVFTWRSSAPVDDHTLPPPDNCLYELPPPDGYSHELPPPDGYSRKLPPPGEELPGKVLVKERREPRRRSCGT